MKSTMYYQLPIIVLAFAASAIKAHPPEWLIIMLLSMILVEIIGATLK